MSDSEYDEKWARRRRAQQIVFAVVAVTVAASLALPMMTSLF